MRKCILKNYPKTVVLLLLLFVLFFLQTKCKDINDRTVNVLKNRDFLNFDFQHSQNFNIYELLYGERLLTFMYFVMFESPIYD